MNLQLNHIVLNECPSQYIVIILRKEKEHKFPKHFTCKVGRRKELYISRYMETHD
jgi:hypothetical protein